MSLIKPKKECAGLLLFDHRDQQPTMLFAQDVLARIDQLEVRVPGEDFLELPE